MLELLKKHFGYDAFRPLQKDVIDEVMSKRDTLVLMPTGGGKSLCYQLPALKMHGMTLVISPLIALMKDQVDALVENGIAAAYLSHTLSPQEIDTTMRKVAREQIKLLYVAPERFASQEFRLFLRDVPVGLVAIDEAHCISEWGHDFRPDYRNLSQLRFLFPDVPLVALTATANVRVRQDILEQLQMQQAKVFVGGFNRPNLTYIVRPKQKAFEQLVPIITRDKDASVIIYCGSRKETERIAEKLQKRGLKALPYHAGLNPKIRTRTQEKFIRDEVTIICATIAFGMGIDKPDVRTVVHMGFPKSVEAYYQETGRAGRDGLPSECIFFYSPGDRIKQEYFIRQISDPTEKRRAYEHLSDVMRYAELKSCRRKYLLEYFGEKVAEKDCQGCDRCLGLSLQHASSLPTIVRSSTSSSATESIQKEEMDQNLFEQLRKLRRGLAAEKCVAPYMIFGDRTLQDMAKIIPQTKDDMRQVFGVGDRKLTQFGDIFLHCIKKFAAENGIADRPAQLPTQIPVSVPRPPVGSTYDETATLAQSGFTLQEIAKQRGFGLSTIINHLERLAESNRLTALPAFTIDSNRFSTILDTMQALRTSALGPVHEKLGASYSYEEIRWVRLKMKWEAMREG